MGLAVAREAARWCTVRGSPSKDEWRTCHPIVELHDVAVLL